MNAPGTAQHIAIPERLAGRPRDRRGYVVPWSVFVEPDGTPQFTINEETKRLECLLRDLCPLCGSKLWRFRWFLGGPASAFHEQGAYSDPPMHFECMRYAVQVCPYLAAPHYAKRVDTKLAAAMKSVALAFDPNVNPERPEMFVAVLADGQVATPDWYVKPFRPYKRLEFWRAGAQLTDGEALKILAEDRERWPSYLAAMTG